MHWRLGGWSAVAALALLACSSNQPAAQACVAGATVACACRGGTEGLQTCLPSGQEYGACERCGGGPGGDGGLVEAGGEGGSGDGGTTAEAGAKDGGTLPLQCADLSKIEPKIDFPGCDALSQAQCRCEGCPNTAVCFDADKKIANDCVCPSCATDPTCSGPAACNHDGLCDPYFEGCSCDDCASRHPLCH